VKVSYRSSLRSPSTILILISIINNVSLLAMKSSCRHETLANTGFAHIQRCTECGGISLHVGPISLRFDEDGLIKLWHALGLAVSKLETRAPRALANAS
jgi:hypothetical protein